MVIGGGGRSDVFKPKEIETPRGALDNFYILFFNCFNILIYLIYPKSIVNLFFWKISICDRMIQARWK